MPMTRRFFRVLFLVVGFTAAISAAADAGDPPSFEVPIACPMGVECFVQNYVDQDPGPGASDFTCGRLTYDGHKGTDIRVPNLAYMRRGVAVLAAAPGTVLRLRDGMADVSVADTGVAAVANREAGNSVIIDHGDGWETQYGHMRKGSVMVKPGDKVTAGEPIGLVGLSGRTEFPHVHFEVRHDGQIVDPYTGALDAPACGKVAAPLWSAGAEAAMAYRPSGLLAAGFAPGKPDPKAMRRGDYAAAALPADSPALTFWVDLFGIQKGDQETLRLVGPAGGLVAEDTKTAEKPWAQAYRFVGKKAPAAGWPLGVYRGEYRLVRTVDGKPTVVIEARRDIELR